MTRMHAVEIAQRHDWKWMRSQTREIANYLHRAPLLAVPS